MGTYTCREFARGMPQSGASRQWDLSQDKGEATIGQWRGWRNRVHLVLLPISAWRKLSFGWQATDQKWFPFLYILVIKWFCGLSDASKPPSGFSWFASDAILLWPRGSEWREKISYIRRVILGLLVRPIFSSAVGFGEGRSMTLVHQAISRGYPPCFSCSSWWILDDRCLNCMGFIPWADPKNSLLCVYFPFVYMGLVIV